MSNNNHLGIYLDENIKNIFVIGDIHGDFYAFKQVLELTKCVTFNDIDMKNIFQFNSTQDFLILKDGCDLYNCEWNEEMRNIYIVFAGDLVDRCRNISHGGCINTVNDENCDLKILKLIFDLDKQAKKYNSRVLMVLGNHEILNLDSDFRYVSFKGLYKNLNPLQKIDRVKEMCELFQENIDNVYGILQINNFIIVHGGINYTFFDDEIFDKELNNIEKFNSLLRDFINNKSSSILFNNINSPFWDRALGLNTITNHENCKQIFENNILKIDEENFKNLKIIVAHCPQFLNDKSINLTDCNKYKERIWRIDVGMSRAWDRYVDINNEYKKILFLLKKLYLALTTKKFPDKKCFYKIQKKRSREASVLSINKNEEIVIKNKLVLDYFYCDIDKSYNKDCLNDDELHDKNICEICKKNKYNTNILIYTYLLQDIYLYFVQECEYNYNIKYINADMNTKYFKLFRYIKFIKKMYLLKIQELNIIQS
jgi:hypothetical protein